MRIKLHFADGSTEVRNYKSEETFLDSRSAKSENLVRYDILLCLFDFIIKSVRLLLAK